MVGFMGAGKSTVARHLASELGLDFFDTDAMVEQSAGATVADIFRSAGEAAFRELEALAVSEALAGDDRVVAVGGGALGDAATCAALRQVKAVHLEVTWPEASQRLGEDDSRPMLIAHDPEALLQQRRADYERIATFSITTDGKDAAQVAREVIAKLGEETTSSTKRIPVEIPGRPYEVFVGRGVAGRVSEWLAPPAAAEIAVLITHPSLEDMASPVVSGLEDLGLSVHRALVPEGEASKSLATAAGLYDSLASAGAHKTDLVVSFGGGVISDVAGFVAATYHRGMPVAHVPTSLMGQVDAAIGGKTGVNSSYGKNLVGAIHQPLAVVCDVELLATLPEPELRSGLSEVVKYGLIAAPDILDLVEQRADSLRDPDVLLQLVGRSAAIKAGIVALDEREQGVRAHLNYGHTFAHAIEHARGLGAVRHGEAVALGMMAAAYLGQETGRLDETAVGRHRSSLEAVGLPVAASLQIEALERAWAHDKKYRDGVRFVLLRDIGRPEAGVRVERPFIERALERMTSV